MVFHWRLSDSKSPQISRTLLSILAVFNNAVVWMVSTRPPSFFQFSSKVEALISLFTFFQFYSVVSWDSKIDNFAGFLFFVDY